VIRNYFDMHMDIEAIRAELIGAPGSELPEGQRMRAARERLIKHGLEAFEIAPSPGIALHEIIRVAIGAPPNEARRKFAVILVCALGIGGLLPMRGESERLIRSFLEQALLNPLRRAGYPFAGSAYDKRQALAGLHAMIDEHLRPPEPSIPRWLHGLGPRAEE
jgi:hypothetical protein